MKIKIIALSIFIIVLFTFCKSPVSSRNTIIPSSEKPDIWCKLNFKLTIKANSPSNPEENLEGCGFSIKVWSYNIIHTLEREIRIENQSIEGEWDVDGFKTGEKEYRFELCYLHHADAGVSYLSTLSKDAYSVNLQITSVLSSIIISPESFSEICSFGGIGDRKSFKFLLSRE